MNNDQLITRYTEAERLLSKAVDVMGIVQHIQPDRFPDQHILTRTRREIERWLDEHNTQEDE